MTDIEPRDLVPLSDPVFHILLALSDRPRHGLGIVDEVEERTGGEVQLGTSTLYTAVKRLRERGLLEESATPDEDEEDPRRRYYRLTDLGRRTVRSEAARLERLVAQARGKSVLPAPPT